MIEIKQNVTLISQKPKSIWGFFSVKTVDGEDEFHKEWKGGNDLGCDEEF